MVTCKEYVHYIEVVIQNDHIITAYLISQNWGKYGTKIF